jgi:probable phosphoglycerate mutase
VGVVVLVRHGETAWSASGQHTSVTDIDLTGRGAEQAAELGARLTGYRFGVVLSSPRLRARRTAELAGLTVSAIDEDLTEWDYGRYEGLTTAAIRTDRPDWSLWTDGAPEGESPAQVQARVDHLLARVRPLVADSDVALVAHGHILRVIGARWIGLPASGGGSLALDTASLSVLDHEHGTPVLGHWNLT